MAHYGGVIGVDIVVELLPQERVVIAYQIVVDGGVQAGDKASHDDVVGRVGQGTVEAAVGFQEILIVRACLLQLGLQQRGQLVELSVGSVGGNHLHGLALKYHAHAVPVEDDLRRAFALPGGVDAERVAGHAGRAGDKCAHSAADFNQPPGLQQFGGLPHHRAAYAELLGKLALGVGFPALVFRTLVIKRGKLLSGPVLTVQNHLCQPVCQLSAYRLCGHYRTSFFSTLNISRFGEKCKHGSAWYNHMKTSVWVKLLE